RSPHPRPRRTKRLVHHLRQKTQAQTQRTPRFRRTLAPLPHRRQLVHVARLPPRRQRRHAQNPPRQSPPQTQAKTQITHSFVGEGLAPPSFFAPPLPNSLQSAPPTTSSHPPQTHSPSPG